MASSKKKSSKKPAAKKKKKAAPVKQTSTKKSAPKKKAAKPAPKAAAQKKPAAQKKSAAPKSKPAKPTLADSWGNAAMAPKVAATTPPTRMSEPSLSPPHALHDHTGGLVSPVDEEEELAERVHGGEEAVKDEDEDTGSPRLDDRQEDEEE